MQRIAIVLTTALAMLAFGCTFQLRDESTTWGCGDFRYEINPEGAQPDQIEAVHRAIAGYVGVTGRRADYLGETVDRYSSGQRRMDDPILIEWFWPTDDGQPTHFGYAEPHVDDNRYVGGFIYLHPMLGQSPADLVERVTRHELGHIGGLDHVDADDEVMNPLLVVDEWGLGDIVGLALSHERCRP